MVNLLCSMLGNRLLKAFPEAGTSTSDQQATTMQHIDQVCTRPSTYQNVHFTVKFMFLVLFVVSHVHPGSDLLAVTSRCVPWQCQVTHIATCLTWSIVGCAHRTSPVDGFFARAESITGWSAAGILGVYCVWAACDRLYMLQKHSFCRAFLSLTSDDKRV